MRGKQAISESHSRHLIEHDENILHKAADLSTRLRREQTCTMKSRALVPPNFPDFRRLHSQSDGAGTERHFNQQRNTSNQAQVYLHQSPYVHRSQQEQYYQPPSSPGNLLRLPSLVTSADGGSFELPLSPAHSHSAYHDHNDHVGEEHNYHKSQPLSEKTFHVHRHHHQHRVISQDLQERGSNEPNLHQKYHRIQYQQKHGHYSSQVNTSNNVHSSHHTQKQNNQRIERSFSLPSKNSSINTGTYHRTPVIFRQQQEIPSLRQGDNSLSVTSSVPVRRNSEVLKTLLRKKACLYEASTSYAIAVVTWQVGRELALRQGYFSRQCLQSGVHDMVQHFIDSKFITRTKVNRCMQIILNSCFHYIIPPPMIDDNHCRGSVCDDGRKRAKKMFALDCEDDVHLLRTLPHPWGISTKPTSRRDECLYPNLEVKLSVLFDSMGADKNDSSDCAINCTEVNVSNKNNPEQGLESRDDLKGTSNRLQVASLSSQSFPFDTSSQSNKKSVLLSFNENIRSCKDVFRCHNDFIRDVANSANVILTVHEWMEFFNGSNSQSTSMNVEKSSSNAELDVKSEILLLGVSTRCGANDEFIVDQGNIATILPVSHDVNLEDHKSPTSVVLPIPGPSGPFRFTCEKRNLVETEYLNSASSFTSSTFFPENESSHTCTVVLDEPLGKMSKAEVSKFRTSWCGKRYDHNPLWCAFAHSNVNGGWLRRDPAIFSYEDMMCPHIRSVRGRGTIGVGEESRVDGSIDVIFRMRDEKSDTVDDNKSTFVPLPALNGCTFNACPHGVKCSFAHSEEEILYHPKRYKKMIGGFCPFSQEYVSGSNAPIHCCHLRDVCPHLHCKDQQQIRHNISDVTPRQQQIHRQSNMKNNGHHKSSSFYRHDAQSIIPPSSNLLSPSLSTSSLSKKSAKSPAMFYVSPSPESEFDKSLMLPGLRSLFRRRSSVLHAHCFGCGSSDRLLPSFSDGDTPSQDDDDASSVLTAEVKNYLSNNQFSLYTHFGNDMGVIVTASASDVECSLSPAISQLA